MGRQIQVVDGEGRYVADNVERFFASVDFGVAGVSYLVVAIMGPQSSGKSTLLNVLVRARPRTCSPLCTAPRAHAAGVSALARANLRAPHPRGVRSSAPTLR